MGTLGLNVDDDLEHRFRDAVYQRKGMKKGNITEALEEAMNVWIDPEAQKIVEKYRTKTKSETPSQKGKRK